MPNNFPHTVNLGTRASGLARWQTEYVIHLLKDAHPHLDAHTQLITTRGDQILDKPLPLIGGKGVFTAELEVALRNHEIDFAVAPFNGWQMGSHQSVSKLVARLTSSFAILTIAQGPKSHHHPQH